MDLNWSCTLSAYLDPATVNGVPRVFYYLFSILKAVAIAVVVAPLITWLYGWRVTRLMASVGNHGSPPDGFVSLARGRGQPAWSNVDSARRSRVCSLERGPDQRSPTMRTRSSDVDRVLHARIRRDRRNDLLRPDGDGIPPRPRSARSTSRPPAWSMDGKHSLYSSLSCRSSAGYSRSACSPEDGMADGACWVRGTLASVDGCSGSCRVYIFVLAGPLVTGIAEMERRRLLDLRRTSLSPPHRTGIAPPAKRGAHADVGAVLIPLLLWRKATAYARPLALRP